MLPHERSLVKRMEGRPFALIGINGDEPDDLKAGLAREKVTWRSFRNSPGPGKLDLAELWGIEGWPTLYLIDQRGVIRHRWAGSPGEKTLERAIEQLVAEAEKKDQ
jgi:hypothetical protein